MTDLLLAALPYLVTGVVAYLAGLLITWHRWRGRFIRPAIERNDRSFTIVVCAVMTIVLYQVMTGWIASTRTEACQIATSDIIRDNVEAARALGTYGVAIDRIDDRRYRALVDLLAAPIEDKDEAAAVYAEIDRDSTAEMSAIVAERAALTESWPPLPDRICEHG